LTKQAFFFHFSSLDAPNLDVGLLTVAGVSCEASNHLFPNASLERDKKALIDLVDGLSSGSIVLVSVMDDDLADFLLFRLLLFSNLITFIFLIHFKRFKVL
jgi:hypothetical protein